MKQTSANVYVNTWPPDKVLTHGSNNGFVTTSEGIVMIDTPYLPTNAVEWRDEIADKGEVLFIINTENHRDHITGNYFFPRNCRIIAGDQRTIPRLHKDGQ